MAIYLALVNDDDDEVHIIDELGDITEFDLDKSLAKVCIIGEIQEALKELE